jgi:chitin deacetylase
VRIRHRFVWQNTIFAPWQQVAQTESIASFLPAQFRGRIFAEAKLNSKERAIALTFDDGPWPKSTSDVLDILKQNQIKATFFMIGQNVQNYPHLAQQVAADGHAIGNHTWHHWYRPMDSSTAAHEVEDTTAII